MTFLSYFLTKPELIKPNHVVFYVIRIVPKARNVVKKLREHHHQVYRPQFCGLWMIHGLPLILKSFNIQLKESWEVTKDGENTSRNYVILCWPTTKI